jgi:hypothetical protein
MSGVWLVLVPLLWVGAACEEEDAIKVESRLDKLIDLKVCVPREQPVLILTLFVNPGNVYAISKGSWQVRRLVNLVIDSGISSV